MADYRVRLPDGSVARVSMPNELTLFELAYGSGNIAEESPVYGTGSVSEDELVHDRRVAIQVRAARVIDKLDGQRGA